MTEAPVGMQLHPYARVPEPRDPTAFAAKLREQAIRYRRLAAALPDPDADYARTAARECQRWAGELGSGDPVPGRDSGG